MVTLSRGEAGPLGPVVVGEDEQGLCVLLAGTPPDADSILQRRGWTYQWAELSGIRESAVRQLAEYACGERQAFDFPLSPRGTEFQQRVWQMLLDIPYGRTRTYGDLAKELGMPNGARAVGGAVGANLLFVVVPCHRVLSPNSLTGFAGGLEMKRQLLTLEGSLPPSLL